MKIYNLKLLYEIVSELPENLISEPSEIQNYMAQAFVENPLKEAFYVIPLNRKNRPLGRCMISLGTANSALVHPREVFQPIILAGASAFIVCHNHPSGDPAPSRADIQITRRLRDAARIIDITLLDHIIIGSKGADPCGLGYYSFNDSGLMDGPLPPMGPS